MPEVKEMKPIYKSATTYTVAGSAAGVTGILQLIRAIRPDALPWDPTVDVAVTGVVTAISSRIVAWFRRR